MNDQQLIERFNAHAPAFIGMLGGRVIEADAKSQSCVFEFNISRDFCHSVDVVQGGFVTAMVDAATTFALYGANGRAKPTVSTLEIKTNYFEPSRAGRLKVVGRVIREGYRIAFMEGEVYDHNGTLTANASTVAKLSRPK